MDTQSSSDPAIDSSLRGGDTVQSDLPPGVSLEDLSHRPGTVLLDSALPGKDSKSLLGFGPREILRGKFPDVAPLEAWLQAGAVRYPEGGLMGWVSYEGDYCFGGYEKLHRVAGVESRARSDAGTDGGEAPLRNLHPAWSEAAYLEKVARVREYIAAGDIYQACLCYLWEGDWHGNPWDFYRRWRVLSPAPYASFQCWEDRILLSTSPELFLDMRGREIRTRPIKGTRRRGNSPGEEAGLRAELLGSEKERAELLMITDLERNDLGRICRTGSVRVEDLFALETFAHLHHLVSTIRGELRPEVSHPSALASCFPGGSITGAPKIRAMEILRDLEGVPRGVYTGAMGWFGCNGESGFNIAIRTLEVQGTRAVYGTGSGIVADSDPRSEWLETHTKAAGLLAAASP